MEEFWKWMVEKGYGFYYDRQKEYLLVNNSGQLFHYQDKDGSVDVRLLIGYMVEYLQEMVGEENIDAIMDMVTWDIGIEATYKCLEREIERL